jgi:hypothetical protein
VTNAQARGSPACYLIQHFVTKAGSYGNEITLSSQHEAAPITLKLLILKGFKKLARELLYCWHNNNNKQHPE